MDCIGEGVKIMMVIRAACILATLAAVGAHHVRAEIPIGFSTPLTGPHAWVGEPHLAGTELAVADINAKGGILGEPLELILVDDGCNAELAPLAADSSSVKQSPSPSAPPARALRSPPPKYTVAPAS
jgi:ABC-type branched-subunit amino acid transport system substrate-binding protein